MHSQIPPCTHSCRCRQNNALQPGFLLRLLACLIAVSPHCILYRSMTALHVVRSDEGSTSLEIGKFTAKVADVNALAKLSQGPDQQSWWTLANTAWHDSAFGRFFAAGPLRAEEMTKLADAALTTGRSQRGGVVDDTFNPWVRSDVKNVSVSEVDVQQALQNRSTTWYKMGKFVKGTGQIEASLWNIIFRCRTETSCKEGYMVPLVVTNVTYPCCNQEIQLSYGTLWLSISSTLLVNAIPADLFNYSVSNLTYGQPSILINVHDQIPQCPPKYAFVSYRSHLDASYGLLPGAACIRFSFQDDVLPPSNFRLLLATALPAYNVSALRANNSAQTAAKFIEDLDVSSTEWLSQPFEKCVKEALLVKWLDHHDYVTICHEDVCVDSPYLADSNFNCSITKVQNGLQWLKFLQLVASLSESCSKLAGGKLTTFPDYSPNFVNVSCKIMANVECSAEVGMYTSNITNPFALISRKSNWTTFNGRDTSEFEQGPASHTLKPCIKKVDFLSSSRQSSLLNVLQIHATTALNSLIQAHATAFTVEKGPPMDTLAFIALIASTAISVLFAFAGASFTRVLLRAICWRWPRFLHSDGGAMLILVRLMFPLCNVVLSVVSFLPVLFVAFSERDREKPFFTWNLESGDYFVDRSDEQLRVITLLSASSKYESHFITISLSSAAVVCLIVYVCTAYRINTKRLLLQKISSFQSNHTRPAIISTAASDEDRHRSMSLMVIEMTGLETQEQRQPASSFVGRLISRRWSWNISPRPAAPDTDYLRNNVPSVEHPMSTLLSTGTIWSS